MPQFHKHVFVCINERAEGHPRGCCRSAGGDDVAAALKQKCFERGLKRIVRPNKAGCLDQCAHGVAMVVYPDAVWYGGVTVEDLDEIIEEHLIGGRPVERLRIPEERLTGRALPEDFE